jgi:hypothetical protein
MSYRPGISPNLNKPLINGASMATSITGPATCIDKPTMLSYDLVWTGTPVGTFQVQVSNTYSQNPDGSTNAAGNWTTIPSTLFQGTYPVPSGSASGGFLDVVLTGASWVRLVYTATSGAGNLTVVPSGKVT